MKKVLVIYNPVSGAKSRKNVEEIVKNEIEKNKYTYDWFETRPVKKQSFDKVLAGKYHRVIVVGGDGTVAEVASFLIQQKIKTPMVIVPQGTGNLLSLTLGIPRTNIRRAIAFGLKNKGKSLDAMCANKKHYALTGIGKGYDAFVMKNTSRAAKKRWGFLAYAYTFLVNYFFHRAHSYDITIDGKKQTVVAKSIVVLNALPIPGLKIGSKVKPDDGVLNIAIFRPRWFRSSILKKFTGKKIRIHSDKDRDFDLDGEVLNGKTITIEVVPSAIQVVFTKSF